MCANDGARDENVLDLLLQSLDDSLDGRLFTLLGPIGKAIAESIAGSRERIEEFRKRYGDEGAHYLEELEYAVVEDFLGLAFLAAQAAYISPVVSGLNDLHGLSPELTTTTRSKRDLLRYGFQPAPEKVFSPIEIVDAFANYYKHGDEWGPDWTILTGKQQETARIISSVGAYQSSTKNLRTGAEHFGNSTYSEVNVLVKVLSPWRKALVRDYRDEIQSKSPR